MSSSVEQTEASRLEAILDQAAWLFYERGYGAVGMRTIAELVGVRASSLYHYFDSKTDLLYQISLGVTRDFIDQLLPILDSPIPYPERTASFILGHIELRWRRRHWISTTLQELRSLDPERSEEIAGYLRVYQRTIQDFITRGVAAGAFHVNDPWLVGVALLDMINGVNGWYRPQGSRSLNQIAESYAQLGVYQLLGAAQRL
jgi:AcrR family transcriptional regulator